MYVTRLFENYDTYQVPETSCENFKGGAWEEGGGGV